jgi:hypothetical protein
MGINHGSDLAWDLQEVAALIAGKRNSPEYQKHLTALTEYFNAHTEKIHSLAASGPCYITRGAARAYCIEHNIPIPSELPGPETIEELSARVKLTLNKNNDCPAEGAPEHVVTKTKGAPRANAITALICLAFTKLGSDVTSMEVIGFLRQFVGQDGSLILEEREDGFLIDSIDDENGGVAKILKWKDIRNRIARIKKASKKNPNHIRERATRVSRSLHTATPS